MTKNPASDTEITPLYSAQQSLQVHDNEVIERCAKVADKYYFSLQSVKAIRALKR